MDGEDARTDNLCFWRCLAVRERADVKRGTEFLTKTALKLAREYYDEPKLKREEVRATRLVDLEGIAKRFKINIRVFEPKDNNNKAPWRLVYGQNQYKKDLDTINIGMLQGHCFYIKKMDVLTQHWECEVCTQRFTRSENLTRHKQNECEGIRTKIICKGDRVERMQSSSEKVFYPDKGFSYAACQWMEAMSKQTGRHIHHALRGMGENVLYVRVVRLYTRSMGLILRQKQYTNTTAANGMDAHVSLIEPTWIKIILISPSLKRITFGNSATILSLHGSVKILPRLRGYSRKHFDHIPTSLSLISRLSLHH
ncbi:uncharacterized protein LOC130658019 [Hydractinia symbiolongicarpus]|uniref:uncharacterized protein LOC130658019 n=1 Tax=Hydractinia symbiolongicarpus TaxID=13093 RepID=UPI00254E6CBE|nr:uncharacterized protein LOC130658019 [Hydractinia symbiolongicarpus]XP_057317024.1 uncharacterized protein LOC130658019 [Hydractinia symbiolongicarpus]XP_057317025.1 uncharacterized protein LOC130658019 [Hydractinia symbiolongicarpus]XP_057317026.1 uncharacterized protein LOC130658019 [Hydractinia symbiolongicarpus]